METLSAVGIFIYILGFLTFFVRNAMCRCGEHFFFWGFIQSFFWFIIIPYRIIKDLFEDGHLHSQNCSSSNTKNSGGTK